jgi:hypothetical protein
LAISDAVVLAIAKLLVVEPRAEGGQQHIADVHRVSTPSISSGRCATRLLQ